MKLAAVVFQPRDLERVVPFQHSVRIVVDRLARPSQQACGGVVFREDQMRVALAALQRDADRHLAQRAARQRVRSAERLRTEQHMNSERSALPHQPVEQQRGRLRVLVVLDEELLEFVHDQQNARHLDCRPSTAEAREVLHADIAEKVTALFQNRIQPFEHADTELAVTLDGDDSRVRQFVRRVGFELDPLFEVDQIKVKLIRPVMQRGVRDEDVQERRFARAGLAGDEHMLRRPFAQPEML